jgi:hypothetical protein
MEREKEPSTEAALRAPTDVWHFWDVARIGGTVRSSASILQSAAKVTTALEARYRKALSRAQVEINAAVADRPPTALAAIKLFRSDFRAPERLLRLAAIQCYYY